MHLHCKNVLKHILCARTSRPSATLWLRSSDSTTYVTHTREVLRSRASRRCVSKRSLGTRESGSLSEKFGCGRKAPYSFCLFFLPKIRFRLRLKRPLRGSVSAKSFRRLGQLKLAVMFRSCPETATQKKSLVWGTNLFAPILLQCKENTYDQRKWLPQQEFPHAPQPSKKAKGMSCRPDSD